MTPNTFHQAMMAYCSWARCSVTSYYRTPKRNALVGGVHHSRHQLWLGADVVYDEPIDELDRKHMASRLGMTLVVESDHDHLQG